VNGTVWLDRDGNGRADAGEPGIDGVEVILVDGDKQVRLEVTAADGSYQFVSLPPGLYLVKEIHPAWASFSSTPDEVGVQLLAEQTLKVDFGDWLGASTYLPVLLR